MTNSNTQAQDTNAAKAGSTDAVEKGSAAIPVESEDFAKAMNAVELLVKSGSIGREQELLNKSLAGQASVAEKAELAQLLSGEKPEGIAKSVSAPLDPHGNETFQKTINASEYISNLHTALTSSFGEVAKALEKSDGAREREVVVLAKALIEIGKLVAANARLTKSLEQQLAAWSRQPANAPRGLNPAAKAAAVQPIQKGLAERTSDGAAAIAQPRMPGRQEILDGLVYLAEKNGPENFAKSGEAWAHIVSKFETTNEIDPMLLQDVMQLIGANRGAQA